MDVSSIGQLVSTVGFPIVVAGAMFWYMVTENRESRKVIENNTQVLMRILEHVKEEDDG